MRERDSWQVEGTVAERVAKSDKIPTGHVEIFPDKITLLGKSKTPPFKIEVLRGEGTGLVQDLAVGLS